MASILIFSPRCKHSSSVIDFINSKPQLQSLVRYHNVNELGIPQQYKGKITSVPTLVTSNGKFLVGSEVLQWFYSLLPSEISQCDISGGCKFSICNIEDDSTEDNLFNLNNYGQSLQPVMKPDLEAKISRNVNDAFSREQK